MKSQIPFYRSMNNGETRISNASKKEAIYVGDLETTPQKLVEAFGKSFLGIRDEWRLEVKLGWKTAIVIIEDGAPDSASRIAGEAYKVFSNFEEPEILRIVEEILL